MDSPGDLNSLQFEYLSLGNPDAVPAGRYAKTWLEYITIDGRTLWSRIEYKIVPSPDVRAALGLVKADANILAIVYRTDAAMSDEVRVLYEVPVTREPEIRYACYRPRPERTGNGQRIFAISGICPSQSHL